MFEVNSQSIIAGVVANMRLLYDEHMPVLPGATEVVRKVSVTYPTAIASSSPPPLIEHVVSAAGILSCFRALVSADTVGRGKPAPDVFLAAARALGVAPERAAVFEDSGAGIRAGHAAGMMVIVVPNVHYPPPVDALALASHTLSSLLDFNIDMLA